MRGGNRNDDEVARAQGGPQVGVNLGRGVDDHEVVVPGQLLALVGDAPGTCRGEGQSGIAALPGGA